MCTDYQYLNRVMIKNKHHMPRMDDLPGHLKGANIFSQFRLGTICNQIRLKEDNIPKMSFYTRYSLYEVSIMPLRFTNVLSLFMDLNMVFEPFLDRLLLYLLITFW